MKQQKKKQKSQPTQNSTGKYVLTITSAFLFLLCYDLQCCVCIVCIQWEKKKKKKTILVGG